MTAPAPDSAALAALYDRHAAEMENTAHFYRWVAQAVERYGLDRDAAILDAGCGPGALLEELHRRGYRNLAGLDFSPACLRLAAARNLPARLTLGDLTAAPLAGPYDAILMTGVIDFVADPRAALRHVRAGLRPAGRLFLTIRNLRAYWPWYHLRPLARRLDRRPRARHWFLHLTTPLSLRRDDYPIDEMYTPGRMRAMLRDGGFAVEAERSAGLLPMLWIDGRPRLLGLMRRVDALLPSAGPLGYRYLFVCRPAAPRDQEARPA